MDIFQFAMEKEKYSEHYYRDLAKRTNHAGLRNILTMLADEEVKHYHVAERMKAEAPETISDTPIVAHAREIFEKMRGSSRQFSFNITEVDLYRKACEIEQASKDFYLEQAEKAEDAGQKEVFRKLAAEEDKHLFVMENIRSFVSQPETFLENAEFFHYDDYVGGVF